MSSVLVTGPSDGLGLMAAQRLVLEGHEVVLHACNEERAKDARAAVPEAREALVGDLSSIAEMRAVAEQANASGHFDAVIHNAGVGYRERRIACAPLARRPRQCARARLGRHEDGRPGAPDDIEQGAATQVWLAVSDDPDATVSGRYFYHQQQREFHPAAADPAVQDGLLQACEELAGVAL